MKIVIAFYFSFLISQVAGQHGYVITSDGAKMEGYLKRYKSTVTHEIGIECWKDKKDKNPVRIPLSDIYEFSINQKVKRVLKEFKPFADSRLYIELSEAELISNGKFDLLRMPIDHIGYSPFLYIIEDSLHFLTAIPNTNDILDVLDQFIPKDYVRKFVALNGRNRLSYSDVPILIHGFNKGTTYFNLKPENVILLQVSNLIENASEIFNLHFSEILFKPRMIIGDKWKIMGVEHLPNDTLIHSYHSFEIETGGLRLGVDKTEKIITIQFFPKKPVTKDKLKLFLTVAYGNKMTDPNDQKYPTFVKESNNHNYAFTIDGINNLYYLLIADLPKD
jgi:hypothetical protein